MRCRALGEFIVSADNDNGTVGENGNGCMVFMMDDKTDLRVGHKPKQENLAHHQWLWKALDLNVLCYLASTCKSMLEYIAKASSH